MPKPPPPRTPEPPPCQFCGRQSCYCCPECGRDIAEGHAAGCGSDPTPPIMPNTPVPVPPVRACDMPPQPGDDEFVGDPKTDITWGHLFGRTKTLPKPPPVAPVQIPTPPESTSSPGKIPTCRACCGTGRAPGNLPCRGCGGEGRVYPLEELIRR